MLPRTEITCLNHDTCDKNNHNTTDCRAIAKFNQQKQKKAHFEAKSGPGKKSLVFLFEEINALKRQLKPEMTTSSKKSYSESILYTEINLTNSSDEGEEYLFTSSKLFRSSKTKLAKSSHPTNESVVSMKPHSQQ
jgi:hypothetical protein